MSVTEQEKLIESMASLDEKGQTYLMGVMAGLVAMQERKEETCCGKCGGEMCAEGAADGSGQEGGAGAEG